MTATEWPPVQAMLEDAVAGRPAAAARSVAAAFQLVTQAGKRTPSKPIAGT